MTEGAKYLIESVNPEKLSAFLLPINCKEVSLCLQFVLWCIYTLSSVWELQFKIVVSNSSKLSKIAMYANDEPLKLAR